LIIYLNLKYFLFLLLHTYNCEIDKENIKDLKLSEQLYACNNKKIKNIDHLNKLKILNFYNDCGTDQ
jgi:hypothetical protein